MNQNRNQPQSLRILPFEGATNFRELGGYLAADGRRVKYGLLYRGATTCDLVSIADRAALGSLGLKLMNQCRSGILGTWDRSGPSGSLYRMREKGRI